MKAPKELLIEKIQEAIQNQWPSIIIAIDLHGVLIDSENYNNAMLDGANIEQAIKMACYTDCIKPLQLMTIRKDIKLFLYTSTEKAIRILIGEAFENLWGIEFDYLNSVNLNLIPTRAAQSFKEKPYFDILLDNSAGFEPLIDWTSLVKVMHDYYIIPKSHGDSSRKNN